MCDLKLPCSLVKDFCPSPVLLNLEILSAIFLPFVHSVRIPQEMFPETAGLIGVKNFYGPHVLF